MDPLFALPPDDLGALDDAELAALKDGLKTRVSEVVAGRRDPDVVGERTQTEVTAAVEEAVLAIESIDAELKARSDDDSQYDGKMDSLAERAGVEADDDEDKPAETLAAETPPTPDEDDDPAPAPPDEEKEGTTASADKRKARALPAARRHKPVAADDDLGGLRVTQHAAGLGSQFQTGQTLTREMLGEFLNDIVTRYRVPVGQKAVVAHAAFDYPRDRMLTSGPDSHDVNSQRIRDALKGETTAEALVASGGLCAPLPAIYELPGIETAARPVRAALPSFQATRGGVQVGASPSMGGFYQDAVGVVTQEENAAGGTSAVKNCLRIECPDFTSVTVDTIYQCIEADNLAARTYPELMSRIADLVNAEQARLADSKLLTAIKAGSTNVTAGGVQGGAVYSLVAALITAAAGIRSRNRMTEGAALQTLIPAWVVDLLAMDVTRAASQDNRSATRAAIETLLRVAGIVPNFYLDGPDTGNGMIFDAQAAGSLEDFPPTVEIAMFPAGSWLHLDAGELNLGVVRDSSLNATNDFQIFQETWENVAFTGIESLWLTVDVCPSGTFAGGIDLADQCGASETT